MALPILLAGAGTAAARTAVGSLAKTVLKHGLNSVLWLWTGKEIADSLMGKDAATTKAIENEKTATKSALQEVDATKFDLSSENAGDLLPKVNDLFPSTLLGRVLSSNPTTRELKQLRSLNQIWFSMVMGSTSDFESEEVAYGSPVDFPVASYAAFEEYLQRAPFRAGMNNLIFDADTYSAIMLYYLKEDCKALQDTDLFDKFKKYMKDDDIKKGMVRRYQKLIDALSSANVIEQRSFDLVHLWMYYFTNSSRMARGENYINLLD